jgi:HD superfamily phosphodiesterase
MVSFEELKRIVCDDHMLYTVSGMDPSAIKDLLGEDIRRMFEYGDQHNPFHIYTLWDHTIHVVKGLPSGNPDLRVAALFHDVGKAVVGVEKRNEPGRFVYPGHPEASARIAEVILRDIGCPKGDLDKIAFLVRYHDSAWNGGIERLSADAKPWLEDLRLLMIADVSAQAKSAVGYAHGVKTTITQESKVKDIDAFIDALEK